MSWGAWALGNRKTIPSRIKVLGDEIRADFGQPAAELDRRWTACKAVLELHATADEVCAGVGIPVEEPDPKTKTEVDRAFILMANMRLGQNGTLADVHPSVVRVVPKLRTPQCGITLRSLSQHISAHRTEVDVQWSFHETLCSSEDQRINLLVLPWPEKVQVGSFKEVEGDLENMNRDEFRFFSYEPSESFPIEEAVDAVRAAKKQASDVHVVIFPECAVPERQVADLQTALGAEGVKMLVAGVFADRKNYAHLGLASMSGKGVKWQPPYQQHKHHRWCLNESQIRQYNLGSVLHPTRRWWEHIDVEQRELHFVTANEWLTVCHLICEDLARQDPVAGVLRGVGPTLVVALLMDGPQLERRWAGRYATVLAEDPGSAVLSVTSVGMSERSRPPGQKPSRVVGLWKDRSGKVEELALDSGARGLLLTLCARWVTEWSADGRCDNGATSDLLLSAVEQIHVP